MRDARIIRSHHQMAMSNFKYGRSGSARHLLMIEESAFLSHLPKIAWRSPSFSICCHPGLGLPSAPSMHQLRRLSPEI